MGNGLSKVKGRFTNPDGSIQMDYEGLVQKKEQGYYLYLNSAVAPSTFGGKALLALSPHQPVLPDETGLLTFTKIFLTAKK